MANVRITIDGALLGEMDRVGKPLGLKRSQILRQALREWLHRRAVEQFEQQWIQSLVRNADDPKRAEDWRSAQSWSE